LAAAGALGTTDFGARWVGIKVQLGVTQPPSGEET
jgi:hypothetical protein